DETMRPWEYGHPRYILDPRQRRILEPSPKRLGIGNEDQGYELARMVQSGQLLARLAYPDRAPRHVGRNDHERHTFGRSPLQRTLETSREAGWLSAVLDQHVARIRSNIVTQCRRHALDPTRATTDHCSDGVGPSHQFAQ